MKVAQSCPTLCESCSVVSDSLLPEILQARILEWVAVPFSRGSSQPRDRTRVSCLAGGFFTNWAIREAQLKGMSIWVVRAYQVPEQVNEKKCKSYIPSSILECQYFKPILKASRGEKHLTYWIRHFNVTKSSTDSQRWKPIEKYQNCEERYFVGRILYPFKWLCIKMK